MSDRALNDETRVLRAAQANLISVQAMRIALMEARVEVFAKRIVELEAENMRLAAGLGLGVKAQVQA